MKCKGKVEYANKDTITEKDFAPENAKFRVTMCINLKVLESIRAAAKQRGMPYQTFINQTLTDLFAEGLDEPETNMTYSQLQGAVLKQGIELKKLKKWKAEIEKQLVPAKKRA